MFRSLCFCAARQCARWCRISAKVECPFVFKTRGGDLRAARTIVAAAPFEIGEREGWCAHWCAVLPRSQYQQHCSSRSQWSAADSALRFRSVAFLPFSTVLQQQRQPGCCAASCAGIPREYRATNARVAQRVQWQPPFESCASSLQRSQSKAGMQSSGFAHD